jgi:hypothetical protein
VHLIAADGADPRRAYARTDHTFIGYSGPLDDVKRLVDALAARLREWEVHSPVAAGELWSRHFVRHAGASAPIPG